MAYGPVTMRFKRTLSTPARWALGALTLGALISGLLAWHQKERNFSSAQSAFEALSGTVLEQLSERMRLYEYGLRGARGTVLTAGENGINHRLFSQYSRTRDVDAEFPGARGFGFIRRVPKANEQAFVREERADGRPDFTVRAFSAHDQERFVIEYIEPTERNGPALGLDIGSEANRRQAALSALQTGKATITAPITLVQTTGETQRSLLFLLPIYRGGATPPTIDEREDKGFGWSFTPLALKEVLTDFDIGKRHYDIAISDITNAAQPEHIFASSPPETRQKAPFSQTLESEMFGRLWRVDVTARPSFATSLGQLQPTSVLAAGLLTSTLLTMLIGALQLGRARERHNALQQGQLATIVENSADAIVGEYTGGGIVIWNSAAARLFGFSPEQASGKNIRDLIVPRDLAEEDAQLIAEVHAAGTKAAFDTVRLNSAGEAIAVSVTAGAIRDEHGRIVGVAKLIRDIRERMAAEHQLREFAATLDQQVKDRTAELELARHDLQTVLDSVPSMIGYWDQHLRNRVANRAYTNWFGVDPDALTGKSMPELLGDKLFELNRPHVEAALRGEIQRFERSIPRPDGAGMRHSLANYLPDVVDGEVLGFYVIVHDITEIVESRQTIARERERLAHIIEGTNVGTWEWNVKTGDIIVNERWADMMGYALAELQPVSIQTWTERSHPEDLLAAQELLQEHFEGKEAQYQSVVRMRHKQGHWVWVQSRGRVFTHTAEGDPEWMFGTHQDISATKVAEERLQNVVAMLEGMLRAATETAIIATDHAGTITLFNTGAEKMLGYTAREMVGVSTPAPLHVPHEVIAYGQELSEKYGRPVQGFEVFVHEAEHLGFEIREWTYVRKDGSHFRVQLAVNTIRDTAGDVIGYLGMAQDMTERHKQDQRLRDAKVEAEAANAAKSMFLANMSHEIRTPMNAVLGVAHLLADTPLDDDQKHLLAKLQIAGRSLLGIINDVLDLSKIEAGEMRTERVPFQLPELATELLQLYGAQAGAKGVELQMQVASDVPPVVLGDPTRLRQVLSNLISNAIKFTQHGTVAVAVARGPALPMVGEEVWVHFSVRDTGEGIAEDARQRLFTPFVQADATTTRRFGGTGLGLSIVKNLVQLMGGDVSVRSTLGEGSEFQVHLPLTVSSEAALPMTATEVHAGLNVMVVDDSDNDRSELARLCRAFGWRTTECRSGGEMVRQMQEWVDRNDRLPDALLVDWQMPEMDGIQALHQVAAHLPAPDLPATLVISAHEREQIAALEGAYIVNCILTKPVNASTLFNAVNASVAKNTGLPHHVMASTQLNQLHGQWLEGLHLLLVDDSDINLEVAKRLLERQGARVQTCVNGQEALNALATPGALFDAVLMDVQMPVMDGYEATTRIRSDLNMQRLPVIALTAGALSEERRRADAAGMNHFLTKPLDPTLLVRTVRTAVATARGADLPLLQGNAERRAAAKQSWPEIAGIVSDDAAYRLQGDAGLFLGLLERLLREHATGLPALDASATAADREALTARVHKLRGSAGMLGALALHAKATELENELRNGDNDHKARTLLNATNTALEQLQEAAPPVIAAFRAAATTTGAPSRSDTDPGAASATRQKTEQGLDSLHDMLMNQELAAMDSFDALAADLTHSMDAATLGALRDAIHSLQFANAATILSNWRTTRAPSLGTTMPKKPQ